MEHACDKCGAPVEEGTAFCPHCNRPLIRVDFSPEAAPAPAPPQLNIGLQWSHALVPTLLAGLISSFLMLFPLGAFGLGMILAGVLSVVFYRWRNAGADLTPGMGARLGAISGVIGFVMFLFYTAISATVLGGGPQLRQALTQAIEQSASRATDPQAQRVMEFFRTPQGLATVMIAGIAFAFIAFLLLSTLGGALGAALLRRKPRQ
jgi:hypothetical protein